MPQAQDSTTEPGSGVKATVEGQAVAVGRLEWVQQQARIRSHSSATTSSDSSSSGSSSSSSGSSSSGSGGEYEDSSNSAMGSNMSGQSVIYVGLEGKGVVGALGFSDTLRPDAR